MSNVPEGSDSNFTWESFQAGVNKDLADVLGNFVSRVTKFAARAVRRGDPGGRRLRARRRRRLTAEIERRLRAYEAQLDAIELRKAAQELRALWAVGNEYLQAAAPWTAIKTDPERAAAVTRFAFNLIRLYAALSRPFIPDASDAMLAALGLDGGRLAGGGGDGAVGAAGRARRSRCPRCCSPRSTTPAGPISRRGSRGPEQVYSAVNIRQVHEIAE